MRLALALTVTLLAAPAAAQIPKPVAVPKMTVAEGLQLFRAAGFNVVNGKAVNACGTPANPRTFYTDMNGDGRPEAITMDDNDACYGPGGQFTVLTRSATSAWRVVGGGNGTFNPLAVKTKGWHDFTLAGSGCRPVWQYNGTEYLIGKPCPAGAAPPPAPSAAAPALNAAEQTAIFKAAGFIKRGQQWRSDCDDPGTPSYEPGAIDTVKDLNGDGLPEAIVIEGGAFCYGNIGQAFWLVSKQADGRWKLLANSSGIPEFLKTEGVGGWPDISVGGPGFCFPVVRWNGKAYAPHRQEYQGKPCR